MMGCRVVSYNVRRFTAMDGSPSFVAIAAAIAALRPSIVCLNEVDMHKAPEALAQVAAQMSQDGAAPATVEFFGHVRGRYGNAIISSWPVLSKQHIHLDGGTEVAFAAGTLKLNGEVAQEGELHRIARGLLVVELQTPAGDSLYVGCTHLDHISMQQREVQLQHVLRALKPMESTPTLLVGDLNALSRQDYSDQQWDNLCDRATSRGWALPASGDLDLLHAAGFEDAAAQVAQAHAQNVQLTAHSEEPLYRIDYCFFRGNSLKAVAADVPQLPLSDHFPLVIDLELDNNSTSLRCTL